LDEGTFGALARVRLSHIRHTSLPLRQDGALRIGRGGAANSETHPNPGKPQGMIRK
jgi:hypothetical protein